MDEDELKLKVVDRRHWVDEKKDEGKDGEKVDLERKPSYVEKLERKAAEDDRKLKEYINAYKEKMAEYDRYRVRLQNDVERRVDDGIANFLREVIPALDNLDLAVESARRSGDVEILAEGIKMVKSGLMQTLAGFGMKSVVNAGEKFSPATAEAVQTVDVSVAEKDNTVMEVLQQGFVMKERLLRPARVKVGRYAENK